MLQEIGILTYMAKGRSSCGFCNNIVESCWAYHHGAPLNNESARYLADSVVFTSDLLLEKTKTWGCRGCHPAHIPWWKRFHNENVQTAKSRYTRKCDMRVLILFIYITGTSIRKMNAVILAAVVRHSGTENRYIEIQQNTQPAQATE